MKKFIDFYIEAVTHKSGGGGGYPEPTGSITITQNGTHDVKDKATAVVSVPNTYAAGDEGKVVENGALVSQTSQTITENGTYDTTTKNAVTVDVQGSGGDTLGEDIAGTLTEYENNDLTSARQYGLYSSNLTKIRMNALESIPTGFLQSSKVVEAYFPGAEKILANAFRATKLDPSKIDFSNVTSFVGNYQFGEVVWGGDGKVTFPKLETVGQYAFYGGGATVSRALKEIDLPKLKQTGSYMFYNQAGLTKATFGAIEAFPASNQAFNSCTGLKTVVITQDQTVATLGANVFTGSQGARNANIYVPDALYDQYAAATNWSTLATAGRLFKLSELPA